MLGFVNSFMSWYLKKRIPIIACNNANAAEVSAKELMNSGYKPIEFLSSNKAGAVTVILKKGGSYWYCWMLPNHNSRCWEVR